MAHQPCNLRDCQCSDDGCVVAIAAAVKADIPNHRIRERLQVLEAWKLDADAVELHIIHEYEELLRDALPSYWDEKAKDRREEFREEDARSRGLI